MTFSLVVENFRFNNSGGKKFCQTFCQHSEHASHRNGLIQKELFGSASSLLCVAIAGHEQLHFEDIEMIIMDLHGFKEMRDFILLAIP